jgi:hypothetical protein
VLSLHKLDLTGPAGTVRLTATEATLLQAFAQSSDARLAFEQVAKSCTKRALKALSSKPFATSVTSSLTSWTSANHEPGHEYEHPLD